MGPLSVLLLVLAPFLATNVNGQMSNLFNTDSLSQCLQGCLKDILALRRDFSYQVEHLEDVCDKYEDGEACVRDCNAQDQESFRKITTFHRLNCMEFRDELDEHVDCLKEAAADLDKRCKEQCTTIEEAMKSVQKSKGNDVKDTNNGNAKEMDAVCRSIKCSTTCNYKLLSANCPQASDILLRINLRQAEESRKGIPYEEYIHLPENCLTIFDSKLMKTALNENSVS